MADKLLTIHTPSGTRTADHPKSDIISNNTYITAPSVRMHRYTDTCWPSGRLTVHTDTSRMHRYQITGSRMVAGSIEKTRTADHPQSDIISNNAYLTAPLVRMHRYTDG